MKHEIYAAAFGDHFLMNIFLQGVKGGACPPCPLPDPLLRWQKPVGNAEMPTGGSQMWLGLNYYSKLFKDLLLLKKESLINVSYVH